MNKGLSVVVGVVVVILIIVVFWALRGRPAGDQTNPLGTVPVATTAPAAFSDLLPAPTQTPVTGDLGEESALLPIATPAQIRAVVSIAVTGFSPANVTIPVGGSVTFTNADTEPHQIASNPHPVHTNFQALNIVVLAPGASGTVVFDRAGTFGYHDHLNPGLTGSAIVQ